MSESCVETDLIIYRMPGDGNLRDNHNLYKSTGRYYCSFSSFNACRCGSSQNSMRFQAQYIWFWKTDSSRWYHTVHRNGFKTYEWTSCMAWQLAEDKYGCKNIKRPWPYRIQKGFQKRQTCSVVFFIIFIQFIVNEKIIQLTKNIYWIIIYMSESFYGSEAYWIQLC